MAVENRRGPWYIEDGPSVKAVLHDRQGPAGLRQSRHGRGGHVADV